MTLFALIVALLIEQLWPLPVQRAVLGPLRQLAGALSSYFNGEQSHYGQVAWALAVVPFVVPCALLHYFLFLYGDAAALPAHVLMAVFDVVVLYFTLGFRQESHFFTDIHLALRIKDLPHARLLLAEWRGGQYEEADADELARLTIEQALVSAHRCVFGVACWFVALGPAGAVGYRLARFLNDEWGARRDAGFDEFGQCARQVFALIDWIPSRLTVLLFAIGGNFEDAVFCWRTQAMLWPDRGGAILVASGAGALGVKLGLVADEASASEAVDDARGESGEGAPSAPAASVRSSERAEIGVGSPANVDSMQGTIGLVWRALVGFMMLLALTTVAVWVGGCG
ncbi:MAG: CobD/CbiB family protein [Azoarcus sp.]|jgi:adenosylcobinamide-phosphate synthase|nr:CobD/CbiB family protein [Azoarcus sp.]